MKSLKYLTAGLLALAVAGSAPAFTTGAGTVTLRIAGSTAFRVAVQKSVEDILKPGYTFAIDGGTIGNLKANAAIFHGFTQTGNIEVVIKTFWTGSLAGALDLTSGRQLTTWMDNSVTTSTTGADLTGTSYAKETAPVSIALADCGTPALIAAVSTAPGNGGTFANGLKNAAIHDGGTAGGPVALVTFQWVLGALTGSAPFTNITQEQANALIATGAVPLSIFTNNPTDQFNYVFLVGRNEDSGTRINAFAEPLAGIGTAPLQAQLAFSTTGFGGDPASTETVTSAQLWPANSPLNTQPSLNWNTAGHSGYTGGGDVAKVLNARNPASHLTIDPAMQPFAWDSNGAGTSTAYFVGYLGTADAAGVTQGTALTYNGVAFSNNAVNDGQYTFWGFEHFFYLTASTATGQVVLSGNAQTVANQIADMLQNTDADTTIAGQAPGVRISTSTFVTRLGGEGTTVVPNY